MTKLRLEALRPTSALGFLAGVGVLRLATEELSLANPRLAWPDGLLGPAVLSVDQPLTVEDLAGSLFTLVDGCKASGQLVPELRGFPPNTQAASGSDPMRSLSLHDGRVLAEQTMDDGRLDRWLTALVAPAAPSDGQLELSQFLTVGPGTVWVERTLRSLLDAIGDAEAIANALLSWSRADSIGAYLDSRADVDAARAQQVRGSAHKYGEPAASWLALMALPAVPTRATTTGRTTVGWRRVPGTTYFRYPVWTQPADLPTVRVLLDHPVVRRPRNDQAAALGVVSIMESKRLRSGNYNGPLAEPVDILRKQ